MNPAISVVIPTSQNPKLLYKCLNSLLNQTLNKELFEVIVIDDSNDWATRSLVDQFYKISNISVFYSYILS